MAGSAYAAPNAMGLGIGGGPSADLRLAVPGGQGVPVTTAPNQTTGWHQPSAHYSSDLSAGAGRGGSWAFPSTADYMGAGSSPATGMPGAYHQQAYPPQRLPQMSSMSAGDNRLMPLQGYDGSGGGGGGGGGGQPTSRS